MHLHDGRNIYELLMDQVKAVPRGSEPLVSLLGQGFFAKSMFIKFLQKLIVDCYNITK